MNQYDYLHDFFQYCDDGTLVWKVDRRVKTKGKPAGSARPDGYVCVRLGKQRWLAHRIVFAMWHGYLPEVIDHIDGNPSNNRIENLREADGSKNQQNRKLDCRSRTGVKNVSYFSRDKNYMVRMKIDGRVRVIGYCKDLELAELLATMAREKYFGEFARHA